MGRDLGHASADPILLGQLCEVAWNQGDDLCGDGDNALLAISEYTFKSMSGIAAPWVNDAGCDATSVGAARALDSGSVHLSRTVKAGDAVDFAVYGGYGSGNTPLELTVTPPVPTPTRRAAPLIRVAASTRCSRSPARLRQGR